MNIFKKISEKAKTRKKLTIISAIVLIVLVLILFPALFKKKGPYKTVKAEIGQVFQFVSESGQIKKGDEIKLGFKSGGRIESIYVATGKKVLAGEWLAKLDSNEIQAKLQEARASLALAEAKLSSGQISLEKAKQSFSDVKEDAEQDLKNAYEDGLNVLEDAFIEMGNSHNIINSVKGSYFYGSDTESLQVKEGEVFVLSEIKRAEAILNSVKETKTESKIESALEEFKEILGGISEKMKIVRDNCEKFFYKSTVSSADKTLLDNHKAYLVDVLTDVFNAKQSIDSIRITNQTNVNAAQSALRSAEEDIYLRQAEIVQAKSQVLLYMSQAEDAILKSPVQGQVIDVLKRQGETAQAAETVLKVLPLVPFEVEADIYEEDIGQIEIFDPVEISLIALPEKPLKGKVIRIKPAEKIVDEVVYYTVFIGFDEVPENIKPGMTADIEIITDLKENALILPRESLIRKNGDIFVSFLENGKIKEKKVEIGMEGDDGKVEILSGVVLGEEVILP